MNEQQLINNIQSQMEQQEDLPNKCNCRLCKQIRFHRKVHGSLGLLPERTRLEVQSLLLWYQNQLLNAEYALDVYRLSPEAPNSETKSQPLLPPAPGLTRFTEAVETLQRENISDAQWAELADAISGVMLSENCHQKVRDAAEQFRQESDFGDGY